jgi:hypothetical protein
MPNVSESNALNTLLRCLGIDTPWDTSPPIPTSDEAMRAAALLADKANRVLGAGVRADDVIRCWPRAAPPSALQAKPP